MIYLDTCYIAKLYLREPDSSAVRAAAQVSGTVACSHHGLLEVLSVFQRHLREKQISSAEFAGLCREFLTDAESPMFVWIPTAPSLILRATTCHPTLPDNVFLRAADAVHLTAASGKGFTEIYSSDKRLLTAAPHFGLKGVKL